MATNYDRGRPKGAVATADRRTFELGNSEIVLEPGPAGHIARIEREDTTEYAGPLDDPTIKAIEAVARRDQNAG